MGNHADKGIGAIGITCYKTAVSFSHRCTFFSSYTKYHQIPFFLNEKMSYLTGVNHVNITISPGSVALEEARRYYVNLLGLKELPRPENLDAGTPGLWLQIGAGPQQVHISADETADVRLWNATSRRHPAFDVTDVLGLREHMMNVGANVLEAEEIPGYIRFFVRDPWGNRLEFMQPAGEVVGLAKTE